MAFLYNNKNKSCFFINNIYIDSNLSFIIKIILLNQTELSLSQAVYRWPTHKKTAEKIGKPIFVLAKYEKIYRITIPSIGAGLILISIELDANVIEIVDKVLEIKNRYS